MKKTALILSMILLSSQSFAGANLSEKVTKFLDNDASVQILIQDQGNSCAAFSEPNSLTQANLLEQRALTEEALLSHAGELAPSAIAEVKADIIEIDRVLNTWPADVTEILSTQADCARGAASRGVSVSVGAKKDGSLVLLSASKY